MPTTFKFPHNGYDVKVYRKEDIVKCIKNNIVDIDTALEIVRQCEIDAADFLVNGNWISLPYIGNVRVPKHRQIYRSQRIQGVVEDAKENLTHEKYVLFRKQLRTDISKEVRRERYYKYTLSRMVSKNRRLFRVWTEKHGELKARIMLQSLYDADIVSTDEQV